MLNILLSCAKVLSLILQGIYPPPSTKDVDGSTDLCSVVEGLELEVLDSVAGFVLVMELYWVFSIKYDPRNKNTFGLVEHFCKLPASKIFVHLVGDFRHQKGCHCA